MKFSLITPTYNRPERLERAIQSVRSQAHQDWEMIAVIDSPENTEYDRLITTTQDERVIFLKNKNNLGANYSRNRALAGVSPDSNRVIFLDDDDYLAPDALVRLSHLIEVNSNEPWIVTNRSDDQGVLKTHAPQSGAHYNYARDYLIGRRINGDATHCLETKIATACYFPTGVKNGEEWFYFLQIGRRTKLFYLDENSTLTDGYDDTGLNFRPRPKGQQIKTIYQLMKESRRARLLTSVYLWLYLFMRIVRLILK